MEHLKTCACHFVIEPMLTGNVSSDLFMTTSSTRRRHCAVIHPAFATHAAERPTLLRLCGVASESVPVARSANESRVDPKGSMC